MHDGHSIAIPSVDFDATLAILGCPAAFVNVSNRIRCLSTLRRCAGIRLAAGIDRP
jgi:hypothetical protein